MTRDEMTRMAREAGFPERRAFSDLSDLYPRLERFATLVAAAEREECARVCEQRSDPLGYANLTAEACAAAIRARGEA